MVKLRKEVLVFQDFDNNEGESSAKRRITSQKLVAEPHHGINFRCDSHHAHRKKGTRNDRELRNLPSVPAVRGMNASLGKHRTNLFPSVSY